MGLHIVDWNRGTGPLTDWLSKGSAPKKRLSLPFFQTPDLPLPLCLKIKIDSSKSCRKMEKIYLFLGASPRSADKRGLQNNHNKFQGWTDNFINHSIMGCFQRIYLNSFCDVTVINCEEGKLMWSQISKYQILFPWKYSGVPFFTIPSLVKDFWSSTTGGCYGEFIVFSQSRHHGIVHLGCIHVWKM